MSSTVAFAAHWCTSTVQRLTRMKSEEASGKKNEGDSSGKPSLNFTDNFTENFKLHFQGPRFTVDVGYIVCSKGQNTQFE